MIKFYHENSEIKHGSDVRELDIKFQEKITVSKFVDIEKPTYLELYNARMSKVLGEKFRPYGEKVEKTVAAA